MPNTPTPDTPFAELLRAVQSDAFHITWQKSRPLSDSERAAAKKSARWYLIIALLTLWLPIEKLDTYFFGYFTTSPNPPQSLAGWLVALLWLFFYALMPISFFINFKDARKTAKHSAVQAFPVRYVLQTKETTATWLLGYNAKGLSAALGYRAPLNWQKFTPAQWTEILPVASADEVHRLSQMMIQRLNGK